MRSLAILTVRNEGSFLIDWLAHHRAIGFTDFLVFSNDCQDGTDAMLDRLAELDWITHIRNDAPSPKGPQWAALARAEDHPLRQSADWILVCDIDEYVNIHTGDGSLAALRAALPQATAIPLTWRMFGNAGVVEIEDRPMTEVFTRAAPTVLYWPWRAQLFKTLFRNDGSYGKLGVHRPRALRADRAAQVRWVSGSGQPLGGAYLTTRIFSDLGVDSQRLVQLNHYALGSMQGFLVKADRGRSNREASAADAGYWVERNFSAVEDRSIARVAPQVAPLRAALLADPVLGSLHRQALAWRRQRFADLMREEGWRTLYTRILMAGPSRILSEVESRSIWQHGQNR